MAGGVDRASPKRPRTGPVWTRFDYTAALFSRTYPNAGSRPRFASGTSGEAAEDLSAVQPRSSRLLSPIRTHNGSCSNWGCPIVVVLGCWFSLTLPLTQPKLSAQDCDRFGAGARCPRDFPRDCNGNGQLDGEDIRTGVSEDCNQNGVPDACEIGSVQFAPQPAFPVGGSPEASTVGDFNGDGLMDLASANSSAKGVSLTLLLNKGSRQFDRADFSVAEAGRLIALTTGDLDADGDLDLVELDRSTLSVFRGDGQGGFRVALDVAVSVGVSGLATGDLNADGAADLLVTERTLDQVAVFISDGASAFREPTVFVVGDAPRAPVLADLNGDGFLDVATANRRSDDLSLLWGAGDGTVTAAPNRIAVGVDSSPDRLVARDFDGDGHVDVATGTPAAILMFRGTGNGGFADGRPFFLPAPNGSPVALTAFDADSDGDLDLIAPRVEPAGFAFILNAGDGTFVQAATEAGLIDTGQGRGLVCFDSDRDGDIDIVITNNQEIKSTVFYRNELAPGNHYLTIKLSGSGLNTSGIGSRVEVTDGNLTQVREIRCGNNFVSQNPAEAHFGLGTAEFVDVTVTWPDGSQTGPTRFEADQFLVIVQP